MPSQTEDFSNQQSAPALGPPFDQEVAEQGYLWWYLDGRSADGRHAISIIAFIGSVFSPYYAWSGRGDPLDHVCLNVALYQKSGVRWTMTERGRRQLRRDPTRLAIGPSSLGWQDGALIIDIDEWTAPLPTRLRGRVTLSPQALPGRRFCLDGAGRHHWQPVAPRAAITVEMEKPDLAWRGEGYFDSNFGAEALEAGFRRWNWLRAHSGDGALVLYDAERRDGGRLTLALRIEAEGRISSRPPPDPVRLKDGFWRVARPSHCDAGHDARVLQTLVDAPFYTRSLIETTLYGERVEAFHESLDLDRFNNPLIQMMLPFRMPRTTRTRT